MDSNTGVRKDSVRVLELFSGIGGMHYSLKKAADSLGGNAPEFQVVAAMDISDVANRVYRHNFPSANHISGNICGLTAKKLNKWGVNCIMMSPPCQPFTRQGLQKDLQDPRTQPLVHIVNLLPQIQDLEYVLVENVKGFETSTAYELLMNGLKKIGFHTQTFLISPPQIGVPNSRLRCYVIARKTKPFDFQSDTICTDLSPIMATRDWAKEHCQEIGRISDYLDNNVLHDEELDEKTIRKHAEVIDIVTGDSTNSCCFTKSYGRYAEGTGSIIQQSGDLDDAYARARNHDKTSPEYLSAIRELKLRYFSPAEVSRLMGFPNDFSFPSEYSNNKLHCYRVLGNSLNVKVVGFLTTLLFEH